MQDKFLMFTENYLRKHNRLSYIKKKKKNSFHFGERVYKNFPKVSQLKYAYQKVHIWLTVTNIKMLS